MSSYSENQDERRRRYAAAARKSTQDIATDYGEILLRGPAEPVERERASTDFLYFCRRYGSDSFTLPWSRNHLRAAERIEAAVMRGQMFAFAMPRGSGKTTLARWAVLWAVLYGHSPYVVLVAATVGAAERHLKNIKTTLRFNDLLFADFPEACCAVRHLGGEARKASGQKFAGQSTGIEWGKNQIILATIPVPYAKCCGAIIDVAGMESEIRGRQLARHDGSVARPTLAIVDDPQTRESARSVAQSEQREAVLAGDVKYMAGPDQPIGIVMPCTVICKGDMADRMLDRKTHPEWQGEKTRLVESFPVNEKLWEEYWTMRQESFLNDSDGSEATEFYRRHQSEMDEGFVVTWPERYFAYHGEISGQQHAMNLKMLDEAAFMAEYQNDPLSGQEDEVAVLTADEVAVKTNDVQRGTVPSSANRLTAFWDISQKVLWWAVAAWSDDFSGSIIDYGVWPRQRTNYVTLQTCNVTLASKLPGAGFEAALLAGLESLGAELLDMEWKTEGGGILRIERCLIDANWGQSTNVVNAFCRRSKWSSVLMPSHGVGITAGRSPLVDASKKRQPHEKRGDHWRSTLGKDGTRSVKFDTNYWKSYIFHRLAVHTGDAGCLTLFKAKPSEHRMIADQITAEYCVRTEGPYGVVDQWDQRPDRPDNHFLDCVVGCALAASIQGVTLKEVAPMTQKPKRERMRLSEIQRKRR